MKTKHFYPMMALGLGLLATPQAAKAQQPVYTSEAVTVTEYTCDNTSHYYSNWRDNWFIQLGAGINQPFVERGIGVNGPGENVNRKKMTVTYNFGFGRWFSPYLGFRINALGGTLHWDTPTLAQPTNGWTRARHVNVNAELMWDMLNSMGGVNSKRVFSIIPFVGIGGDYTWAIRDSYDNPAAAANIPYADDMVDMRNNSWTLPVSAGVQFRVRLCDYVDFFAEARAAFYGDNWNGTAYGHSIEANVSALGGFNFNIGGRKYGNANDCAYMSEIASLNGQVNDMRAQLLNSAQAIASLESQLPCPEPTTVVVKKDCVNAPLMTTVRFDIDSAVISPEEEVNVYNMATWLNANPDQNIVIVGYADADTGTADYNMALSEKRANAVADQLVNKYNVSRDRLTVKFDGSNVQPYDTNNWNRIVIFTQE